MKRKPTPTQRAPVATRTCTELSTQQLETVNGGEDDDEIIVIDSEGHWWSCFPDRSGSEGDYFCTRPKPDPEQENDFA